MKLTDEQLAQYQRDGFLVFPNLLNEAEVAVLQSDVPVLQSAKRGHADANVMTDSGGVRSSYSPGLDSQAFDAVLRLPRILNPVRQLLDGEVYLYQSRLNAKPKADPGATWQWHQDFGVWHRDDEMPEPRAMNIALFLEDVTEFNGALMFIPRSHKRGVIKAGHDLKTTSYPLWTIDNDTIARLVDEGGIISPKGTAGSVIMFNSNLVHGSPSNMSPFNRTIVYLSLCHVENHIRRYKRAEWIAHRNFTPIESLPEDCLRELARDAAAE